MNGWAGVIVTLGLLVVAIVMNRLVPDSRTLTNLRPPGFLFLIVVVILCTADQVAR